MKRRRFLTISAGTGVSMLAAACVPSASPGATSTAALSSSSSAATPRRGGTLVKALTNDPGAGSVNVSADDNTRYAFNATIHSALVQFGLDHAYHPDLAESWTLSPDELTYTFKLRSNATFHDGKPVTSADVKYTVEQVAAKYNGLVRSYASSIKEIQTPDDGTVVFVLKQPIAVFLYLMTRYTFSVLPKHIYDDGSDPRTNPANQKPIGSGPFKFQEWVKGDHVAVVRNENFYLPGQPYLDRLVFQIIPDIGARAIAFQKGDLDWLGIGDYPSAQGKQLAGMPGVYLDDRGSPAQDWLYVNMNSKPLNDLRVRQALATGIDRNAVAEKAYFGFGAKAAVNHITSGITLYHDPSVKLPAYDLAAANKLLDDAGYPKGSDGTRFSLRLAFDPSYDLGQNVVRDQLVALGIRPVPSPEDAATLTKSVFIDDNYDLMVAQAGRDDPAFTLGIYSSSTIGTYYGNGSRYQNPQIDQLLTDGAATANVDKRKAIYTQVQQILARDLPTIPLVDVTSTDLYGPKLKGYETSPLARPFYHYEGVWRSE